MEELVQGRRGHKEISKKSGFIPTRIRNDSAQIESKFESNGIYFGSLYHLVPLLNVPSCEFFAPPSGVGGLTHNFVVSLFYDKSRNY